MSSFNFKDLIVWQRSLEYANTIIELCENLNSNSKHYRLIEQIESASSSICQNIAEGNGRNSKKEFIQFLYYSRGSLFETISILNLFRKRNWISESQLLELEDQGAEIGKMINGLINSVKSKL